MLQRWVRNTQGTGRGTVLQRQLGTLNSADNLPLPQRMPALLPEAFDPGYNKRHTVRNARKIQRILSLVSPGSDCLDIGCNEGYISKALLAAGCAARVDAIELNRTIVDPNLLDDPRFSLSEGSVTDFVFSKQYDVIIYNAVHHHVFGLYGKRVAMETWCSIVDHCRDFVLFETGQMVEDGDWYWKQALRSYYANDFEHFSDLFRAIGPRVKAIEIIDRLPIHHVKRVLLKISLHPPKDNPSALWNKVPSFHINEDDWECDQHLRRTRGSKDQKLVEVTSATVTKNLVYDATDFYILRNKRVGTLAFAKNTYDDPFKLWREFMILKQLHASFFLQPLGYSPRYGLLFPYVGNVSLQNACSTVKDFGSDVIADLLEIFEYARNTSVDLGDMYLDPANAKGRCCLIDIVDMHMRNFIAEVHGQKRPQLILIDMEVHSTNNRARNERHLQTILKSLNCRFSRTQLKNPLLAAGRRFPVIRSLAIWKERVPYAIVTDQSPGRGRPNVIRNNVFVHFYNNCRATERRPVLEKILDRQRKPSLLTGHIRWFLRVIKQRIMTLYGLILKLSPTQPQ